MTYYVYALYREDGSPFYIGYGSGSRWLVHESDARRGLVKGNMRKHQIIKRILKSGARVSKKKLAEFSTSAEAASFEAKLIKRIGRAINGGPLVNNTDGGDGGVPGYKHTHQRRRKISRALKGIPKSETAKKHMSEAMKHRPVCQKAIEAMANATRGKPKTKSHRRKISDAKKGKALSPEHIAKLKGRKRSPKACANISRGVRESYKRRKLAHGHETK